MGQIDIYKNITTVVKGVCGCVCVCVFTLIWETERENYIKRKEIVIFKITFFSIKVQKVFLTSFTVFIHNFC